MAAFIAKLLGFAALLGIAASAIAAPPPHDKQQPIIFDAQSADLDLKNNNSIFKKVRISQGNLVIVADQGQATRKTAALDFDDNLWDFRGNVKITVPDGELTSDEAQVTFFNKVLTSALATGSPASFEQKIARASKTAHGTADSIDYDVRKGIIRLSRNAYISDGQNEIRGESLKYNVAAQSVAAESQEQNAQRVHIIITPPPPKPAGPAP